MGDGRTLLRPLAVLLVLCAACVVFLRVADQVREGETQRVDDRVLRSLRTPADPAVPIGPAWGLPAARNLTALGSVPVLVLVVLAVVGFLVLAHRWWHLALVVAASGGGVLVLMVLKRFFDRPRPTVVPPLMVETSPSFPSGHAMMSAVVYLTLGTLLAQLCPRWRERIYVVTVAATLALIVGLTRLYLGVHYPSDVLAGWSIGLAWALITELLAGTLRGRSQRLRAEAPEAEGASPPEG